MDKLFLLILMTKTKTRIAWEVIYKLHVFRVDGLLETERSLNDIERRRSHYLRSVPNAQSHGILVQVILGVPKRIPLWLNCNPKETAMYFSVWG